MKVLYTSILLMRMLKTALFIIYVRGITYVLRELIRRFGKQPISYWFEIRGFFYNKRGLEIGGPSKIFLPGGALPVIEVAKEVDNVNYMDTTIWGRSSSPFYRKTIICEATNLSQIKDEEYDFLITSHTIEHLANPLKALYEWKRVLKRKGIMLIELNCMMILLK
jgi:SAM-dependent methyltransferase